MKESATSLISREMQIKTTKIPLHSPSWIFVELELSDIVGGAVKWREIWKVSYKTKYTSFYDSTMPLLALY